MIKQSTAKNTSWDIGSIVNIGFVKGLKVIEIRSEYDYLPDIYVLENAGGKRYEFIPHNGLHAI